MDLAKMYEALAGLSLGSAAASCHLLEIMARKGLLEKADVDQFEHGLTVPFDELRENDAAMQFQAMLEAQMGPELARIRSLL